ncbi:mechanosensitive ion channel family protein [Ligilactobacillus apodemi]|uniref:Small-conductance mechanosensitive channel n=1 Tax=Ligilactobacillus apodemi DSM 16634 = JCM 16172 TaxID=1423724 RepID=A0A0R1TZG2_9LACO|nr:mechanosensitive ion channel family protein [Ligilactobacillus apodemi]KRL86110.1 small-conductance mechanosensitive channel [Ligilactobacillus apodemi DSM 16634 = JCM 16172]
MAIYRLASTASSDSSISTDVSKQVVKQTGILDNYIKNIDWDGIITKIITTGISLFLISVLFLLIHSAGKKLITRSFASAKRKESTYSIGRLGTIYTLTQNIFHYCVLFFYFYAILSILGIPVSTLLASAGIVSVALGLGAQGFVTDIVTGFFILLEQQFVVGDTVKINTITGTVHAVGLRTTQILSDDGTLNFIPNRSITVVSNMSRNNMQAVVDIRLDPRKDTNEMRKIIAEVNKKLVPKLPDITNGPKILGIVDLGNGNLVFRVSAYTNHGAQAQTQRILLDHYLQALKAAGFNIPISPLNLGSTA